MSQNQSKGKSHIFDLEPKTGDKGKSSGGRDSYLLTDRKGCMALDMDRGDIGRFSLPKIDWCNETPGTVNGWVTMYRATPERAAWYTEDSMPFAVYLASSDTLRNA